MMESLPLSALPHTWILDLDGTLVKHNGYLEGEDELLPGVLDFINAIPDKDSIVILSARREERKEETIRFLKKNAVRYDHILFDMPVGERILINDTKPSGLSMAHAVNLERDAGIGALWHLDQNL